MEVSARHKGARLSAQKARLLADQIRGRSVGDALDELSFSNKKGAHLLKKVLESVLYFLSLKNQTGINRDSVCRLLLPLTRKEEVERSFL